MRNGERGDRTEQAFQVAHQHHEAEHEQQVIEAEQNVLDPETEVASRDLPAGLPCGDHDRPEQHHRCATVRDAPSSGVKRRMTSVRLVARFSMTIGWPGRPPSQCCAIAERAPPATSVERAGPTARHAGGRSDVERQSQVALRRRFPQNVVGRRFDLADLQERGADLVRVDCRGRAHGDGQQQEGADRAHPFILRSACRAGAVQSGRPQAQAVKRKAPASRP